MGQGKCLLRCFVCLVACLSLLSVSAFVAPSSVIAAPCGVNAKAAHTPVSSAGLSSPALGQRLRRWRADVRVFAVEGGEQEGGQQQEQLELSSAVDFMTPQEAAAKGEGDVSESKKARVILYIILSLIPCLLLLPLMSTNNLQPLDVDIIQSMTQQ